MNRKESSEEIDAEKEIDRISWTNSSREDRNEHPSGEDI